MRVRVCRNRIGAISPPSRADNPHSLAFFRQDRERAPPIQESWIFPTFRYQPTPTHPCTGEREREALLERLVFGLQIFCWGLSLSLSKREMLSQKHTVAVLGMLATHWIKLFLFMALMNLMIVSTFRHHQCRVKMWPVENCMRSFFMFFRLSSADVSKFQWWPRLMMYVDVVLSRVFEGSICRTANNSFWERFAHFWSYGYFILIWSIKNIWNWHIKEKWLRSLFDKKMTFGPPAFLGFSSAQYTETRTHVCFN